LELGLTFLNKKSEDEASNKEHNWICFLFGEFGICLEF
jgi:hypothetical protein